MERGEGGHGDGEKSTGRCSSIPDSIGIGHTSPGNSHHGPFVAREEMSAINSSALNTELISLRSILECDACGAPSQNYNDLHPAPSLPTNVTEGEPQQLRINASATSIRTNSRSIFCQEERPLANGHNGKSDQYSSNEEVFPKCMAHMTSAFSPLTLFTGVQYSDDSASSVMERKINQELTDMGYSSETIQLAIRCVQRKGAEMNLEVVANTILDMDQKKTNRAASVCYLCQRDFRNGYTLCPCGHLAICMKCEVYKVAECPVCGEIVKSYVITYPECQTRKP